VAFQGRVEPIDGSACPGRATLNRRIQFDRSFGRQNGTLYAETWPHVPGGSQLPAGTVQGFFGVDYAFVARVAGPLSQGYAFWYESTPTAGVWPTVPGSVRDAGLAGTSTKRRSVATTRPTVGCISSPTGVRPRSQGVALSVARRANFHRPELVARLGE